MKQLNNSQAVIRLPINLKDNIKKYAKRFNLSPSKFIRKAIESEIDKIVEIEYMYMKLMSNDKDNEF